MKKYFVTILVIGLFSMLSTAILAQGNKGNRRTVPTVTPTTRVKKPTNSGAPGDGSCVNCPNANSVNNNTRSANSANAPTKPCNQLTGDDWLYKGRKCTLPNGQVTTVGAYKHSQNNNHRIKIKPKRIP